jgi:hypothetical protein
VVDSSILVLGSEGVAVDGRDGHRTFECHPRHCGFRRTLTTGNVDALVDEARRAGRRHAVVR